MKKNTFARITAVLLAFVMVFTGSIAFSSFANAKDNTVKQELKIAVMSDLHYLSKDLIKDTADYETDLNSDRKIFTESEAIIDTMVESVKEDQPDVLLISGDLTKDGEKQCHEALAAKLKELKAECPNLKIYIAPGNHDNRNSNGKNFNTDDDVAVDAIRTNPEDFVEIYGDVTYNDETIIARYTPPAGQESGQLSYAARPADGFTVIAIDTCRYSADNTDDGTDEHETSGQISAELEAWVVNQIKKAKARGDTVIGVEHHGLVPHFSMEADLLPMYLVKDYERIATEYADAGMDYVFTGHMHANDVAELKTDAGNTMLDIETGSALTYPCPQRFLTITREASGTRINETITGKTVTDLGPITYYNEISHQNETIDNLTAYAQERGFTAKMLTTTATKFLRSYFEKVLPTDLYPEMVDTLINNTINDLAAVPVCEDKELLEYVNYVYQCHLGGEDNGINPAWVNAATENVQRGIILDRVLDVLIKNISHLPINSQKAIITGILTSLPINIDKGIINDAVEAILTKNLQAAEIIAPDLFKAINNFIYSVVDSFTNDKNFVEDNNFTVQRQWISASTITAADGTASTPSSTGENPSTPATPIVSDNVDEDFTISPIRSIKKSIEKFFGSIGSIFGK